MLKGDQLAFYSAVQLSDLFAADDSCKFVALKIKKEGEKTAFHAIYIAKQNAVAGFPYCALVTVSEWDGKSPREEFFLEAELAEQLMEKLQAFDEINSFVFLQVSDEITIETLNLQPQAIFCLLFPRLGQLDPEATPENLHSLKTRSLALLKCLEAELI